jgi:ATP/maltotriose-dependent transcriptional regulator MalT
MRKSEKNEVKNGRKDQVAAICANLAVLSLEEGKLAEAERLASDAIREFEIAKVPAFEVTARGILARALLAEGKTSEAGAEARRELEQARNADDRPTRLQAKLDFAKVQAGLGSFNSAREEARSALAEASRFGYLGDALYARLALGEIELKSGHPANARGDLAPLEKDACSKAFFLVARKAAALSEGPAKP